MTDDFMHDETHSEMRSEMRDAAHDETCTEDAFAHRIAAPLRADERVSSGFDARVLAAIREERASSVAASAPREAVAAVAAPRGAWWQRRHTVALPTAGWIAAAASFAAVVSLATRAVNTGNTDAHDATGAPATPVATSAPSPVHSQTPVVTASHDTVYVVRFVLAAPDAQRVTLVGDFNGWAKQATPLKTTHQRGVWTVDVALPPGRHEYVFLKDGKRWVPDPLAERVSDDFGTESSVVMVGNHTAARMTTL